MRVQIHTVGNTTAAQVTCEDVAGGGGKKLGIVPCFYTPRDKPDLLYLTVTDSDGVVVDRAVLSLSGATGKLIMTKRMVTVVPQYEAEKPVPLGAVTNE